MAKRMKECRVCGAQYAACNSARTGSTVFNWREVACSPECGEIYLERVLAARAENMSETLKIESIIDHTEETAVEGTASEIESDEELEDLDFEESSEDENDLEPF